MDVNRNTLTYTSVTRSSHGVIDLLLVLYTYSENTNCLILALYRNLLLSPDLKLDFRS